MTDSPALPKYRNTDSAPIVYFDIVGANGIMNGAIQIELASRVLTPVGATGVEIEFHASGRIRCSPAAATLLRDAIDQSLEMLKQSSEQVAASPGKLN